MKTQVDLGGKTYCLIDGVWMGPDLRAVDRSLSRELWMMAATPDERPPGLIASSFQRIRRAWQLLNGRLG